MDNRIKYSLIAVFLLLVVGLNARLLRGVWNDYHPPKPPETTYAAMSEGREAYRAKDYDKALAAYTRVLKLTQLSRTIAQAHFNIALCYRAKKDNDKMLESLGASINADPKFVPPYMFRAGEYMRRQQYSDAVADYTEAADANPNNGNASNTFAWLLATSSHAEVRDGRKAVKYAQQACEATKWAEPQMVDTLAVAYAEKGDFEEAVKTEEKYLAMTGLDEGDIAEGKTRLELFKAGKPYHE